MKITVPVPTELDIRAIRCVIPFDEEDEGEDGSDISPDFPGRSGMTLTLTLDFDTRSVRDWPAGRTANLYIKVVDQGSYYLLDAEGRVVASREESYVPSCIPQEYGDYVNFNIGPDGKLDGWRPDVDDIVEGFWPGDE